MPTEEALLALAGLSTGDAFGQSLFYPEAVELIRRRELPAPPWRWTDDTQIALSVLEELRYRGWIDQDALARRLAWRYTTDPARGYGGRTQQILERIAQGEYFRSVNRLAQDGGSYGSAASARAAPLGAYFTGNPARASREARLAAGITHAHNEGLAGAQAVAAAAAILSDRHPPTGSALLQEIIRYTPEGEVCTRLAAIAAIPPTGYEDAVKQFRIGPDHSTMTTVPFSLWVAAHNTSSYSNALWLTVFALGVRDTTCAIVGALVALSSRNIPEEWLLRREPLPRGFERIPAGTGELRALMARPPAPRGQAPGDSGPAPIRIDALTGLPNLLGMLGWLDDTSRPGPDLPVSLLAVQLNSLWEINRTRGRTAGDDWLRWCASILSEQGVGPVFRAGGDKFVVAMPGLAPASAKDKADSIVSALTAPGIDPARVALIHFPRQEIANSGFVLAILYVALAEHNFVENNGAAREFESNEIRERVDFPFMMVDLAAQFQRMGNAADEALRLAQTDSISQLPNMRAALSALDDAVNHARNQRSPLAVLLIDGDNLRQFNQISYENGDEAIRQLGAAMRNELRETDFIARWRTGDEFLVLLPDTSPDQAMLIGSRLCHAVDEASKTWIFHTTISVGISMFPSGGPSGQDLVHTAENGLHSAKAAGKNQVRLGVPQSF
jgi:diguanylate cyclase (GGDEF)-like protein